MAGTWRILRGGAIDDSIITKVTDQHIYFVVNAGGRDKDLAHIEAHVEVFNKKGGYVKWHIHDEHTLLALQEQDLDGNKVVKEVIFGPGEKMYRYCKHI
ncbi:aminomethyltransferase, mitochondrial-like [Panicum virgatum]|uniref:aminomethyltransferase, mitochondrial-like n=1 Tax=Panicum virgatum TaxID=38727 RepID=UPI0019D67A32|nr:aminomethyltransferase, mitochondrial-like [Panicum virgatum]